LEKRTPHYSLTPVFAVLADPKSTPFTGSALVGGLELQLSPMQMRKVVGALTRKCFYKSMTTYADHRVWQDVYIGLTPEGIEVYIKITVYTDERPPVIQFKRK